MQPDKHHELGEKIVEHILRPAFRRAGECSLDNRGEDSPLRLGAFFLGNWIADFSQLIDPTAFADIPRVLKDAEEIYTKEPNRALLVTKFDFWDTINPFQFHEHVVAIVNDCRWLFGRFVAQNDLVCCAEAIVAGGNKSPLANCIREIYRFVAFVAHVPRDAPGGGMDHRMFGPVFDAFFVQYYAHEHFDQTNLCPKDDQGPRASEGPRNGRRCSEGDHEIYAYMRDYIQIMASTLSELDRWSFASLQPHPEVFPGPDGRKHPIGDDQPQWNIALAQLGQVLHLVEDYFAHSTFVEHAIADLTFLQRLFETDFNSEIVDRRRRLPKPIDGGAHVEASINPHVITGYFDLRDTVSSLMAALTTHENAKIGQHSKDTRLAKASALMFDLFHLLAYESVKAEKDDDEKEQKQKAWWRKIIGRPDESENAIAKEYYFVRLRANPATPKSVSSQPINEVEAVLRYVGENAERLLDVYDVELGDPAVQAEAARLLRALTVPLGTLSQMVGNRVAIFSVLFLFKRFLTNPLMTLFELQAEQLWAAIRDVRQWADDQIDQIERGIIKALLGVERPEHHALLAKDSDEAPLHEPAMSLASAVDWYVCHVLFRHHRHTILHVARHEANDGKKTNKIAESP